MRAQHRLSRLLDVSVNARSDIDLLSDLGDIIASPRRVAVPSALRWR